MHVARNPDVLLVSLSEKGQTGHIIAYPWRYWHMPTQAITDLEVGVQARLLNAQFMEHSITALELFSHEDRFVLP